VQDLALGDLGLVDLAHLGGDLGLVDLAHLGDRHLVPLGEGPLDRSFRRRRSMGSSNALFGGSSPSSTTSLSPEV
jgi:hypothetical protein